MRKGGARRRRRGRWPRPGGAEGEGANLSPPLPDGWECRSDGNGGAEEDALCAVLEFLYTGRLETRSRDVAERAAAISGALGLDGLSRDLGDWLLSSSFDSRSGGAKSSVRRGGGGGRVVVSCVDELRADAATLGEVVAGGLERDPDGLSTALDVAARRLIRSSSDVSLRTNDEDDGSSDGGRPYPGISGDGGGGAGEFLAHRFVLCARSDYFRGALLGSFSEARDGSILLSGLSSPAISAVLEWLYADRWNIPPGLDLCAELLEASSRLLLPRMAALVGTVIAPYIDLDNALDLLRLGRAHSLPKLEESCLRVLALQIEGVFDDAVRRKAMLWVVREEVDQITQLGDSDVTDVPVVADMRKMVADHYAFLDDYYPDDDDGGHISDESVSGSSEPDRPEVKVWDGPELRIRVDDVTEECGRDLRRERRHKLALLDRIVREALEDG